jgi:hypothetical protein
LKIKRDPSRSEPLVRKHHAAYRELFAGYEKAAVELLERNSSNAVPTEVVLAGVEELLEPLILKPGKDLAGKHTAEAFVHGQRFADVMLKSRGYVQPTDGRGYELRFRSQSYYLAGSGQRARELAVGVNWEIRPDERIFELLKQRNYSQLKGITQRMGQQITAQLTQGIMKGEGVPALSKRLKKVVGLTAKRSRSFARTEAMQAVNNATLSRYFKAGVTLVQRLLGPDTFGKNGEEYPCQDCLDIAQRDVGYGPGIYPIDQVPEDSHPNCRCTWAPYKFAGQRRGRSINQPRY